MNRRDDVSVCLATLFGSPTDVPVEVWSPDYDSNNFWFVYEDEGPEDRIDLSYDQLRELADVIDGLLCE